MLPIAFLSAFENTLPRARKPAQRQGKAPGGESARPHREKRAPRRTLLAMSNLGPHAAFLAAHLATSPTRLLYSHATLPANADSKPCTCKELSLPNPAAHWQGARGTSRELDPPHYSTPMTFAWPMKSSSPRRWSPLAHQSFQRGGAKTQGRGSPPVSCASAPSRLCVKKPTPYFSSDRQLARLES